LEIPEKVTLTLELAAAIMLVGLGARTFKRLKRGGEVHTHPHRHGVIIHSHPHIHDQGHVHKIDSALVPHAPHDRHSGYIAEGGKQSVLVGAVHGLAGSAGLMLLITATISSFWLGVFYILAFGVGSIGGMLLMSMLISAPFFLAAERSRRTYLVMRGVAGTASISFGLFLCWDVGVSSGLFL
jgi:ABC-type nickel/cobalt efflux system permease component RcnA